MSEDALDAFMAVKFTIDAALAEITEFSRDHFGVDLERVNWGDVGSLAEVERALTRLTDQLFNRREFSPLSRIESMNGLPILIHTGPDGQPVFSVRGYPDIFPEVQQARDHAMRISDQACYEARHGGKNAP